MNYHKLFFLILNLGFLGACELETAVPLSNGRSISKCFAHRGLVDEADPALFQNSMSSFEAALKAGADGAEFDVYLTSDGIPVISHEPDLSELAESRPGRSCPLKTPITELDASEIRVNCVLLNGDDVPTLEEVFARFHQTNFYLILDFKVTPNQKIIDLMQHYYRDRYHLLISLMPYNLNVTKTSELRSRLPTKLLLTSSFYKYGTEVGVDGIETMRLGDMDIARLQEKGKLISLYNVDTEDELKYVVRKNVNFITTNSLQKCLEAKL